MVNALLAPVIALTNYLTTTLVHPVFYPFPWLTTLHAVRISLVHRGILRRLGNETKIGRGPEYLGFLLMVRYCNIQPSICADQLSVGEVDYYHIMPLDLYLHKSSPYIQRSTTYLLI